MPEKVEFVFQKRIHELENVESYLHQQLKELESDRDILHQMARKDKGTMHEQSVRLQELRAREKMLCQQVSQLEASERTLSSRCSQLEHHVCRQEDRVHELEVQGRRLKELVSQLKLDEEKRLYDCPTDEDLITPTEHQLTSQAPPSLPKDFEIIQTEKKELSDRNQCLEVRVKELEAVEEMLVQRLKNYENVELALHSHLQHAHNSEEAAYCKASELDALNWNLATRLQRAAEENALLAQRLTQQQEHISTLDKQLSSHTEAEQSRKHHMSNPSRQERDPEKQHSQVPHMQGFQQEQGDSDLCARIQELEQSEATLQEKVNQLQRSENRLLARLLEFETVGSQVLETLPLNQKQQLPQTLEECQKRVVVLHRQLKATQVELNRQQRWAKHEVELSHPQQQPPPAGNGTPKVSSGSTESADVSAKVEVSGLSTHTAACQRDMEQHVDHGNQFLGQSQDSKSGCHSSRHTAKLSHSVQNAQGPYSGKRDAEDKTRAPEAPCNLHVTRVDSNRLTLAWQPPILDQHGCSNGCRVIGYRIYLNGRVSQQLHKPQLSQAVIDNVKPHRDRPQHVAIQTITASGLLSPLVEIVHRHDTAETTSTSITHSSLTDVKEICNNGTMPPGKVKATCHRLGKE